MTLGQGQEMIVTLINYIPSSLWKHLRLYKVIYSKLILIEFLHLLLSFFIKSCILTIGICYDHLIEMMTTDTQNILYYLLVNIKNR